MRPSFLPALSWESLRSLRVHEVIRDYPEILPLLSASGTPVGEVGAKSLEGVLAPLGPWPERLSTELAWRGSEGG